MSISTELVQEEDVTTFKKPMDVEHQQEELLKTKYPNLKPKGGSSLLQKRMAQKAKYFDSGDYMMARAQLANTQKIQEEMKQLNQVTGDHMPTPDELPRTRKQSLSNLVVSEINVKQ